MPDAPDIRISTSLYVGILQGQFVKQGIRPLTNLFIYSLIYKLLFTNLQN